MDEIFTLQVGENLQEKKQRVHARVISLEAYITALSREHYDRH